MIQDTTEEKDFRKRYSVTLRRMKSVDSISPHYCRDELTEERVRVKQQALITPGRRGEQIKHEEIDKEILRRYALERGERNADMADQKIAAGGDCS
jgi:hypothetical protein